MNLKTLARSLLMLLPLCLPAQPADPLTLTDIASYRDNGLRGEVVLNGSWQRSRPGKDGATTDSIAVPGNPPMPSPGKDAAGKALPPSGPQTLTREFTVPPAWSGRQLVLELGGLSAAGELRVDGAVLATVAAKREFLEFTLPPAAGSAPRRIEVVTTGRIAGDVWLRALPPAAAARIDDSYLTTSFREKTARVQLAGTAKPGVELTLKVSVSPTPGSAAIMALSATAKADAEGRWTVAPTTAWTKDVKPWSRWHPNLYYYTAELVAADGSVLDRLLPRRFGFREIWVEGGQFYLNGVQTNYTGDSWGYQIDRDGNAHRGVAEAVMREVKAQGYTFVHAMQSELGTQVADEMGILQIFRIGSLVRFNIWDAKSGLTPMTGTETIDDIARVVRRFRENPSVIAWWSNTAYSQASMHPEYSGRPFETWNYFPLNRDPVESRKAQLLFRDVQHFIAPLDPTREVVCHNGPFTAVDLTTRYLTNNLDLQEREEFFESWSRADTKQAVSMGEVGVPFAGEYYLRRIPHQMPNAPGFFPKLHLEMAARYFGESVYTEEAEAYLADWTKIRSYEHSGNPIHQRQVALDVRNTWRAWRTYGVNPVAHYILNEDGFDPIKSGKLAERFAALTPTDPRVPGLAKPAGGEWPMRSLDNIRPSGTALIANNQPLLAYLGGPDGHFTTKEHLFFAGAEIKKSAIVINDWDDPAAIAGEWSLVDAQSRVIAQGKLTGTVPAGRRDLTGFPITFTAPAVTERTDYTLKLTLTADRPGTLTDEFALTVFPAHTPPVLPPFAGTVWMLNISDDRTHESPHFKLNRDNAAFLRAAGLAPRLIAGLRTFDYVGYSPVASAALDKTRALVTEGTPRPGDLLIIPRHTLDTGLDERQLNLRLLQRLGLDRLVEQGLNVLILEQDQPNLFGMNTESVRPRRAFIAADGHPVFAGLTDSDLSNWTGASDLQPGITALSTTDNRFPERLWQVSNTHAVASRTFIRPQRGAARALAVSGFDLQESPLLEVTRGRGRLLFCQFDVSTRYGIDPAATRLVDNLIGYALTAPAPDPAKNALAEPTAATLVLKRNLYRAAKPAAPDSWGITAGELFFRESIYKDHWGKNPDRDIAVLKGTETAPLPGVINRAADGRLQTTLREADAQTGWGRRKIAWIRAALLVNEGGSSLDGPALGLHGRLTDLYPHEWVEGFVHPYNANIW